MVIQYFLLETFLRDMFSIVNGLNILLLQLTLGSPLLLALGISFLIIHCTRVK